MALAVTSAFLIYLAANFIFERYVPLSPTVSRFVERGIFIAALCLCLWLAGAFDRPKDAG